MLRVSLLLCALCVYYLDAVLITCSNLSVPLNCVAPGYFSGTNSTAFYTSATLPRYQTQCFPGTYSLGGGTQCYPCDPGTYSSGTCATKCTVCPVGSFCPVQGLAVPIPCPANTWSPLPGMANCYQCPYNTFRDPIASIVNAYATGAETSPPGCIDKTYTAVALSAYSDEPDDQFSFKVNPSASDKTTAIATVSTVAGSLLVVAAIVLVYKVYRRPSSTVYGVLPSGN